MAGQIREEQASGWSRAEQSSAARAGLTKTALLFPWHASDFDNLEPKGLEGPG
jgi:hypothetical protein